MSFKKAKSEVIAALSSNRFRHEYRQDGQKNLLQTGEMTIQEVLELVAKTRGAEATSSPHHMDATIPVWVFRPKGWYIKFYLLKECWFISLHPSG